MCNIVYQTLSNQKEKAYAKGSFINLSFFAIILYSHVDTSNALNSSMNFEKSIILKVLGELIEKLYVVV